MIVADGKVVIETDLDSSGIEKGLKRLGDITAKGMKAAAAAVGATATALGGVAVAAVKVGSGFEAEMSRVQAISGATGKELEELRTQAIQLGADTAFSSSEAAEGMENLAAAGFEVDEIMDAMPGLLDMAAASGEDLANSSDIAASALRGFGLDAKDAGHVADVLAENANRTNSSVAETGEAMKYIAPLARAAGISLEETAAAIGIMANAGIQGSQAGTTLRGALSRLSKPTADMQQAMDELGIAFYDSEGRMLSLSDQVGMLGSAMEGMTDEQKNNYLVTLYGQEALSGMLALINEGADSLSGLTAAYEQCDGSAQAAAATMQDNLKGAVEELSGSAESLGIVFYDSVAGNLKKAAQAATDSVNNITDAFNNGGLNEAVQTAGNEFANLATAAASQAPEMAEVAVDFIQSFVQGIVNNKGQLISAAGDIADALASGLVSLLPAQLQRPVDAAVSALSESLGSGGLKKAGETAVQTLDNVIDIVGKLAKTALPPLINVLDFAGENLSLVAAAATTAFTAFKGYKVVSNAMKATKTLTATVKMLSAAEAANALQVLAASGALTAKEIVIGVITGKIKLATVAQMAWNAVMAANPIGLVITAVGALAAGLGIYALTTDDAADSTEALAEKHKENIEASKEAIKAIEDEAAARQKNINASTAEIDNAEALWGELSRVVDENGKIKTGYEERAQYITGELSDALGIEIGLVDGQITNYQELKGSIYDVIAAKKAEAALSTMESDYNDAKQGQAEITAKLAAEYDKLLEKQGAVKAIEEQMAAVESQVQTEETIQRTRELQDALDGANAELKEQEAAFEAANTDMEYNQKKISDYDTLLEAAMSGSTEKINSALAEIQSGINTTLDAGSDAALDQAQSVGDTLLGILDVQKDGLADIEQSTIDSTAESLGIALNTMSGSAENMKVLLESIGTDGSKRLLDAMKNADLSGNLSEEARSGMQAMIQAMDSMDGELNSTGKDGGDRYASGVNNAISAASSAAYSAGKSLADNADSGAKSKTGRDAGEAFGDGFANGILSMTSRAITAGAQIAADALQAAKNKLQSKSPAKKTIKLGRDFDQGFILGLRRDKKKVEHETAGLADAALNAFDLSDISSRMQETMAFNTGRIAKSFAVESSSTVLSKQISESIMRLSDDDIRRLAKEIGTNTGKSVAKAQNNRPVYLGTDRIDKPLPKGAMPRI